MSAKPSFFFSSTNWTHPFASKSPPPRHSARLWDLCCAGIKRQKVEELHFVLLLQTVLCDFHVSTMPHILSLRASMWADEREAYPGLATGAKTEKDYEKSNTVRHSHPSKEEIRKMCQTKEFTGRLHPL